MSLWAMLGGGLLAFVSPCVLPMLPVYAMYLLAARTPRPAACGCSGAAWGCCADLCCCSP